MIDPTLKLTDLYQQFLFFPWPGELRTWMNIPNSFNLYILQGVSLLHVPEQAYIDAIEPMLKAKKKYG